ncbi:MAG: L-lactate permease [Candidatus Bathyarchaeia archaeon]
MDSTLSTLVYALFSVLPMVVLLILMIFLKWSAAKSGPASFILAMMIANTFFGADIFLLALAICKGLMISIYILYIIWPALALYSIVELSGAIKRIGLGISSITNDGPLQILILSWAFTGFLQGVAGFGIPVAVTTPLLIGLGFNAMTAAVTSLVGHSWAITFGSMGTSFYTLQLVTGLQSEKLAFWSSFFLGICVFLTGIFAIYDFKGFKGVKESFFTIVSMGIAMAFTQIVLASIGAWSVAAFVAGMVGIGIGILSSRAQSYRKRNKKNMIENKASKEEMSFHTAFSPYYALIAIVLIFSLLPNVSKTLGTIALKVPFPSTRTSLGWVNPAVESYSTIPIFSHAGALVVYASIIGYIVYRIKGFWKPKLSASLIRLTLDRGIPASIATISMAMTALVMLDSGMIYCLATFVSRITGDFFPIFSALIGLFGAFITGSNTNSNVLFGPFQRDVARMLKVDESILCSAQTTGGAIGSMLAPAKVIVGASTTGLIGKEGDIMLRTSKYGMLMALMIGLTVLIILHLV